MKWTISGNNTDGYIIESEAESGKWLWGGSGNDGTRVTDKSGKAGATKNWYLVEDDTYGLIVYNKSEWPKYRYLSTYGSTDWRNYNTVSNTQKPANLYKIGPKVEYSNYTATLEPSSVSVTVNSCGNASFSCAKPLDFTDADVKAYMVTDESADAITLTEIKKVPANTGIFVLGNGGEYNIPVLDGDADDASANKLFATTTPYAVTGSDNVWALSKTDGKLHPVTSGTIAAGKAYLVSTVINPTTEARGFVFSEDVTTGINAVSSATINGVAYNLAGQRVNANANGIVIMNGKKYINK